MAVTINGTTGIDTPSLTADTTTLVVDETNNRVGIGTASPSNPLHVLATAAGETTVKFESNQAGAMFVALDVDTDRDCLLQFQEAGTTRWDIFMNGSSGTNPLLIRDDDGVTQGSFDQSGNFKFNSGYGSAATAYGVRAWVNFNGTGTVAIRSSGGVSSMVDNGNGDYTVLFSSSFPDDSYAVSGIVAEIGSSGSSDHDLQMYRNNAYGAVMSTGGFRIRTVNASYATVDLQLVSCMAVR